MIKSNKSPAEIFIVICHHFVMRADISATPD